VVVALRTPSVVVYDDFLTADHAELVWELVKSENYRSQRTTEWYKVWRLGDGAPLGGRDYSYRAGPFGNDIDHVIAAAVQHAAVTPDLVPPGWIDFVLRPYLYPRGTKLSWHNDAGHYSAAFTYYAHPYWASTWGGELLVLAAPSENALAVDSALDHRREDEFLMATGTGYFVSPRPNRAIFLKGGTLHALNRVDADAGDHVRCSIAGFFVRSV
jgi:hypothetical protein